MKIEDLAVRITQLDALVSLERSHAPLLHCCSFLLGRVVYMRCSDVVGWSFACLRKEILTCCVWFYWINQCIMWEIEKMKIKKQHNLLYKCMNLDALFISFQSQSAALKKNGPGESRPIQSNASKNLYKYA